MIVYRALKTPDGTILHSKHRHDFVGHDDKNGNFYAIDGGLDYCRITAMDTDYEFITIEDTDNWEIIRLFPYGVKQPLAKMSDRHLQEEINFSQKHNFTTFLTLLLREESFRRKWNINVNEQSEYE